MATPEPTPFVFVLREIEGGDGLVYRVEIAPLPGGDASPRSRGVGSAREAATSTPPRFHATTPRARGRVEDASAPRQHLGDQGREGIAPPPPHSRPHHEEGGGDKRIHSCTGSCGTHCGAAANGVKDGDDTDRSELEESFKNGGRNSKNLQEIFIPVFLPPVNSENRADETWNKRQIIYTVALLGSLSLIFPAIPILPSWTICLFTAVWGFGTVGFLMGLHGTNRWETNCSRYFVRLFFAAFSVLFIYLLYRSVLLQQSPQPALSSPPPDNQYLQLIFGGIGVLVMIGHIVAWVRGCLTGTDRDVEESVSKSSSSDLFQRLLDRV